MTKIEAIHVVAAIFLYENRVLACRRKPGKSAEGLWEFPGGKAEIGESSTDALVREIREELNFGCNPGPEFSDEKTQVGEHTIRLQTFICRLNKFETFSSIDHDQLAWVNGEQAITLEWALPDLPSVDKLIAQNVI